MHFSLYMFNKYVFVSRKHIWSRSNELDFGFLNMYNMQSFSYIELNVETRACLWDHHSVNMNHRDGYETFSSVAILWHVMY